jgi:lipopolysaccharide/colanic/teichoic acid biosynthesis glycosyltransferase
MKRHRSQEPGEGGLKDEGAGSGAAYAAAKRAMDVAAAGAALLVLSPVIALTALAIRLRLGSPVVFRQARLGRGGRPFQVVKFRTMTDARGPDGALLSDAERLPPFGVLLRRTSLDELPQLWNVLRGDMSLVGPRPLLADYLPRYTSEQARRHEVPPGITGWAQVNGRNTVSWERKFELDVWYVDHRSLGLDLKILWMTLLGVLRSHGISQAGHATTPEFLGTRPVEEADPAPRSPAEAGDPR